MKVIMAIIDWFKTLFAKRKPSNIITMVWSAMGVNPDGGSFFMSAGENGKAFYDGTLPGLLKIPVDCKGIKLKATMSPAPKGGASVLLYRYLQDGKIWIPGWCSSLDFAPGATSMELDLSPYDFAAGMSLHAWGGYPLGLETNQGPIDIKVTVTLLKK